MYFINSLWESILLKQLAAVFFPINELTDISLSKFFLRPCLLTCEILGPVYRGGSYKRVIYNGRESWKANPRLPFGICEYRNTSTSPETPKYERSGGYVERAAQAQHLQQQLRIISSWGVKPSSSDAPSRTRGTSRGMQMLLSKWPRTSHTKSLLLLLLWKSAKTETLPNVPAGHMPSCEPTTVLRWSTERAIGQRAHSLPDHETSQTRANPSFVLISRSTLVEFRYQLYHGNCSRTAISLYYIASYSWFREVPWGYRIIPELRVCVLKLKLKFSLFV